MITKEMIIDVYGEEFLKRSALRLNNGDQIIKKFLDGKGYKTIVEIGTYRGANAAFMSQFCEKVVTIDLYHGRCEQLGEDGFYTRKKLWEIFGINNIEHIRVNNDQEKANFLNSIDFDFAFIDGAHDETIRNDFELVKKCGRVLFHEYDNTNKNQNYSYDFVNENLPKDEITVDDIFALWIKK